MKSGLVVRPRALREVDEIATYIAKDSLSSSLRFLKRVAETIEDIGDFPDWAAQVDEEKYPLLRRRAVKDFDSYLVFYVSGERVIVVSVMHGARDVWSILSEIEEI